MPRLQPLSLADRARFLVLHTRLSIAPPLPYPVNPVNPVKKNLYMPLILFPKEKTMLKALRPGSRPPAG